MAEEIGLNCADTDHGFAEREFVSPADFTEIVRRMGGAYQRESLS